MIKDSYKCLMSANYAEKWRTHMWIINVKLERLGVMGGGDQSTSYNHTCLSLVSTVYIILSNLPDESKH